MLVVASRLCQMHSIFNAYSWFPNERHPTSGWRGHPPHLPPGVSAYFQRRRGRARVLLHLNMSRRPPRDSHEYWEYFQGSGSLLN
jgi:hypothetical protein